MRLLSLIKKLRPSHVVYAWNCVGCYGFYGENTLNKQGKLLCPECETEQDIVSPYVELVRCFN